MELFPAMETTLDPTYNRLFIACRKTIKIAEIRALGDLFIPATEQLFTHTQLKALEDLDLDLPTDLLDLAELMVTAERRSGLIGASSKVTATSDPYAIELASDPSVRERPFIEQVNHLVHKTLFRFLARKTSCPDALFGKESGQRTMFFYGRASKN